MHKNGEMCRKMDSYGGSGTQVAWLQTVFFIVFGVLFAEKHLPAAVIFVCLCNFGVLVMRQESINYVIRIY